MKAVRTPSHNHSDLLATKPVTFNNAINVNVWLSNLDKFLRQEKIQSEAEKTRFLITHLDTTNQELVKKAVQDNEKGQEYAVATVYLAELYTKKHGSGGDVQRFMERKQSRNEEATMFYTALVKLARLAFPKSSEKELDPQVIQQFVNGTYDTRIKEKLLMALKKNESCSAIVLTAMEWQALYANDLDVTETHSDQVAYLKHQQNASTLNQSNGYHKNQRSNSSSTNGNRADNQNRYQDDTESCYHCKERGHRKVQCEEWLHNTYNGRRYYQKYHQQPRENWRSQNECTRSQQYPQRNEQSNSQTQQNSGERQQSSFAPQTTSQVQRQDSAFNQRTEQQPSQVTTTQRSVTFQDNSQQRGQFDEPQRRSTIDSLNQVNGDSQSRRL